MIDQTIHILGAGATGQLWAYHIAQAGLTPVLIPRQMTDNHRTVHLSSDSLTSLPAAKFGSEPQPQSIAQCSAEQLDAITTLLVCVKSYQLASALSSIAHAVQANTQVLILANGMGHEDIANAVLPTCRLLLGSNTHGCYLTHTGELRYTGRGTVTFGPIDGSLINSDPTLSYSLNQALPDVIWRFNIYPTLIRKLAINATINPLTALHQCRNGDVISNPKLYQNLISLVEEMIPVLTHCEPALQHFAFQQEIEHVAQQTASNWSSMAMDVQKQNTTEIESITGFLLRKADQLGLELPTHRSIYEQISQF